MRKFFATIATLAVVLGSVSFPSTARGYSDIDLTSEFYGYTEYLADQGVFSRDNTKFRPSDGASRYEVAKTLVEAANIDLDTSCADEFSDVAPDSGFYGYVKTLVCKGFISKNPTFNGSRQINRGEFTKMAVNAFGVPTNTSGGPSFTDVSGDHPFYTFIESAVAAGMVKGYGNGTFGPGNNVLRQELAKIIAIAAGYSDFGPAAALKLTASAETSPIGSSVILMATVVDADGKTVADYEGDVEFIADAGTLGDDTVAVAMGRANNTLTSPFGATVNVSAKAGNFTSGSVQVIFALDAEARMVLRAADYNIAANGDTILYLTMMDEDGKPVSGAADDLAFENTGSGTLGAIVTQVSEANGVYALSYTANAVTEADMVSVVNHETGLEASTAVNVAQPKLEVEVLQPSISVLQITNILVKLWDDDNAPLAGALGIPPDLTARVLNVELGAVDAGTDLGGGVYAFAFTADNREATARVEIRYNSVPVTHEYVDIEIFPYDIAVYAYPEVINTVNGVATVLVTVHDVNGMPINLDPTTSFDFDVITGAEVKDPSGAETWITDADWIGDGAGEGVVDSGAYLTQVKAVNSLIEDSTVEIVVRDNTTVNETVTASAVIGVKDPSIVTATYFTAALGAPAATDVMVVYVEDDLGRGVEGLEGALADQNGDGDVLDLGEGLNSFFIENASTTPAANVASLGGGLYAINKSLGALVAITDLTLVNADISDVNNITAANTAALREYIYYGDNTIVESTGATATQARTAVAVVATTIAGALIDIDPVPAGPLFAATTTGILAAGAFASPAAIVGDFVAASTISTAVTDEIEVNTVTIVTTNTYPAASSNKKVITTHPIEFDLVDLDTNKKAIELQYAVVVPLDKDGFVIDDVMAAAQLDTDLQDSADEGAVAFVEMENGGADSVDNSNLFLSTWDRAVNTDDLGEATIEFFQTGDDNNIVRQNFDVVNPTFSAFTTAEQIIAARDGLAPAAGLGLGGGVINNSNVFAVAYNDHMVPIDVTADGAGDEVFMEVKTGDGYMADGVANADDTLELGLANLNDLVTLGGPATLVGIYRGTFKTEEKPGESVINVYTQYDDADYQELTVETVYPTADLVLFPAGINPETTNDTAYAIVTARDQYGNSIEGLDTTSDHLLIEIDGDDQFKGSSYTIAGIAGELYFAEFSTDDEDTYDVDVRYNDDTSIASDQLIVQTNN